MRKVATIVAAVISCGTLSADGYVYLITEPIATVSYPAVSAAEPLMVGGWTVGSAAAQEQTCFAGWTREASCASALDARKPKGAMLILR